MVLAFRDFLGAILWNAWRDPGITYSFYSTRFKLIVRVSYSAHLVINERKTCQSTSSNPRSANKISKYLLLVIEPKAHMSFSLHYVELCTRHEFLRLTRH